MQKQPKYKTEIREEIIKNIHANKNVYSLRQLYELSEILRKANDDVEYKDTTEREHLIKAIVNTAFRLDEKYLCSLQSFTRGLESLKMEEKR